MDETMKINHLSTETMMNNLKFLNRIEKYMKWYNPDIIFRHFNYLANKYAIKHNLSIGPYYLTNTDALCYTHEMFMKSLVENVVMRPDSFLYKNPHLYDELVGTHT